MRGMLAAAWTVLGLTALSAEAAVVCQKRSGAMFVRDACRRRETPIDLGQLGAVGPRGEKGDPGAPGAPGEARAYACSQTFDETSASLCTGRAARNVLTVVANSTYPGYTCFVLDPSIDAGSAVVVASLNGGLFGGGKINTIVAAFGSSNYQGCPANSVVVITARHTNTGMFLGLEEAILGVNVAVM